MKPNPYQHALDTKRIALNHNGLLSWVRHNEAAIMSALETCAKIQTLNDQGTADMRVEMDTAITVPTQAFSPAFDFQAEEQN